VTTPANQPPALDLAAIEQREQAATEGSWFLHPDWPGRVFSDDQFNVHIARCTGTRPEANAEFIAAARTDVPALVDGVRQRDAEIARMRSVAQSAAVLLRAAADRHPADAGTYRAAAQALDDTAITGATTGT
jgi:xanthine dehydrogenase iron-sulfur cluster and FAD-binding subunit A